MVYDEYVPCLRGRVKGQMISNLRVPEDITRKVHAKESSQVGLISGIVVGVARTRSLAGRAGDISPIEVMRGNFLRGRERA
jgi:hypothetical protein